MQTIVWEVECLSDVSVRRHCKKCGGKRDFVSSGLFRVNANKKKLDVWLVYRCAHCGASWNLPICERMNPSRLGKGELAAFTQNDAALAHRYAMDAALLARHGCETGPPLLSITGAAPPAGEHVQVVIHSAVPLSIPLPKLLRQKLCLSAKALDAILEDGGIALADGGDVRRQRLRTETRLFIRKEEPLCLRNALPPEQKNKIQEANDERNKN